MTTRQLNVLVVDDDAQRGVAMAIKRCAPDGTAVDVHQYEGGEGGWHPPVGDDFRADLVLFHFSLSYRMSTWSKPTLDLLARARVRVAFSGAGQPDVQDLGSGWYGIKRPIGGAGGLPDGEWKELLNWVAVDAGVGDPDTWPRALRSEFPRVATALLILCRVAISMCDGEVQGDIVQQRLQQTREWMREPFRRENMVADSLKRELCKYQSLPGALDRLVRWLHATDQRAADVVLVESMGRPVSDNLDPDVRQQLMRGLVGNAAEVLSKELNGSVL